MIKCVNLTKIYGKSDIPALNSLNIEVQKNSVFGFLGPNGAGKTTTVKILTGLMKQTSGEFYIGGVRNDINSVGLKSKIGYLGQDNKMYGGMTAQNLLMFVGEIFGLSKKDREIKAGEMLEMAGLSMSANKKISEFSGGMIQRLGIAQALMGNPEVLFLDEPTSALDPIGRKEVLEFIHSLREKCTVFMSTHILNDVERICDSVAILNKGELVAYEKTEILKNKYSDKLIEIVFAKNEKDINIKDLFEKIKSVEILKSEKSSVVLLPTDMRKAKIDLLNFIASTGIDIERFEVKSASLEDVFVKLVGGTKDE
ncbi:MAG TPA: ABC transporter ATP-binding protein [Bacteroidales bacterium]|nr:ABC transporter ATP-binding protein [Bacteroidales bacterium]